jgi:dCTP diphosphatase
LKLALQRFADQRDWRKFHDPRNLAEAISIEASELLETFLWKTPREIETLYVTGEASQAEYADEILLTTKVRTYDRGAPLAEWLVSKVGSE